MPDSLFEEDPSGVEKPDAPDGGDTAGLSTPADAAVAAAQKATEKPVDGAEKPAEDGPWWARVAGGKYKSEDDAIKGHSELYGMVQSKSAEAKTAAEKAAELEARITGLADVVGAPVNEDGTPKDYDYQLPDGVEFQPELIGKLNEFGRARNLSGKVMQDAITDVVIPWQAGLEAGMREHEKARMVEALGGEEPAAKGIKEIFAWASSALEPFGEDAIEELREAGSSAAAIRTIMRLRDRFSGGTIGRASPTSGAAIGQTEYREILSRPGWQNDAGLVAQVTEYLNRTSSDDSEG